VLFLSFFYFSIRLEAVQFKLRFRRKGYATDMEEDNTPRSLPERPPEADPSRSPVKVKKRQTSYGRKALAVVIVLLLIAALVAGLMLSGRLPTVNNHAVTPRPTVSSDGNKVQTQTEADIANIVAKVSPSVVSVTTQSQTPTYFGVAQQEGAGTGIVVSRDGYIMTNKHVVNGADTVGVVLSDGTSYDKVKVVGTDPLNDVAFIKIPNVNNLTPVELGDSSSVRVGQQVVAIGNSLGQYQNTVTSGIISGKGRPVAAQDGSTVESLTDLLQTDAAINPGNSGGPLLNMAGQVIGMNTAVAADAQGIGFAIPINSVKGLLKGVLNSGEVRRAYLGINYIPITPDTAKRFDLSVKDGAYVYNGDSSAVISGSPADKAGIKEKDVITKVNGVEIGSNGGLSTLLGEYAPGDTVALSVLRGGNEMTINVTLDAYKS
jgi:serine protease Do